MSITRLNPNRILLSQQGSTVFVNDLAASATLTPGHLLERFNNSGVVRWRVATADVAGPPAVALDQSMLNKGVDDTYAANDLVEVAILNKGDTAWMLIASGQTVNAGTLLGSAGDGTLKTGATVARFTAIENKGAVVALTRIRVEAL